MKSQEIRTKFLKFFEERGHVIIPSASLVPADDPTTLFTGSGMQPLLPYFLGKPHPQGKRLADSQKCFRAQDIEEVGDNRHTTFFEMLGNWSFGDYFKKEQLSWMLEFLVKEVGLNPLNLYFTCFRGNAQFNIPKDEESASVWQKLLEGSNVDAKIVDFPEKNGMQKGRIFYYDETKNWWSRFGAPQEMPAEEPGGPDSEIFWDFGTDRKLHESSQWSAEPCHVNCDCGRFLEIGNNVFMEYVKRDNGFEKLEQKNVDFGGGLERIAAASNNNPDIFAIDILQPILATLHVTLPESSDSFDRLYAPGMAFHHDMESAPEKASRLKALRIIVDHMRASVFLIADGLQPSNLERGYVLRRLLRRAARYAHLLGIKDGWHKTLIQSIIDAYKDFYPEIVKPFEIQAVVGAEYEKFGKALERGLRELEKLTESSHALTGQQAFDLYQSYGLPLELIEEIAQEKNITLDLAGFKKAGEKHSRISAKGAEQKFGGHGLHGVSDQDARKDEITWKMTRLHTATHLLHQALRDMLGSEVKQMGSDINTERTRFDFSFDRKLTEEEKKKIEAAVNEITQADLEVKREVMPYNKALEQGALAFFKEKYPETVSVYSIGSYSKELCGGPHVARTGEIGRFTILKEEAVGTGIRRIRATVE